MCESSSFVVLFQDYSGCSELLEFPYGFWNRQLVTFYQEASRDFDRDCAESVDRFGEHCHLTQLSLPVYERRIHFYSFRYSQCSLISFNNILQCSVYTLYTFYVRFIAKDFGGFIAAIRDGIVFLISFFDCL